MSNPYTVEQAQNSTDHILLANILALGLADEVSSIASKNLHAKPADALRWKLETMKADKPQFGHGHPAYAPQSEEAPIEDVFQYHEDMISSHTRSLSYCPVGWTHIIQGLLEDIRKTCDSAQVPYFVIDKVTEESGGLHVYIADAQCVDGNSAIYKKVVQLVRNAEEASLSCCEITGHPGTLYRSKTGELKTLSMEKAAECGYERVK